MALETVKKEKKIPAARIAREPKPAPAVKTPHAAVHAIAGADKSVVKKARYTEAVGRRKTAIARVRIFPGDGTMTVNDKDVKKYFVSARQWVTARAPFTDLKIVTFDASVHVVGGGICAQAEAIRMGVARALVEKDHEWKKRLRTVGFMTRDSRMVERKKYGLKKARRAPQWAKR